jgi:hypothetical protein
LVENKENTTNSLIQWRIAWEGEVLLAAAVQDDLLASTTKGYTFFIHLRALL